MHYLLIGAGAGLNPHPLFHTRWYRDSYPDVASAAVTPLEHFLLQGYKADYNPNPWFNTRWYRERYGNQLVDPNPVIDYLIVGAREGRDPSERFSTSFYLEEYDDVADAKLNPLVHFLSYGLKEGRAPLPLSSYRRVISGPNSGRFAEPITAAQPKRAEVSKQGGVPDPRLNALKHRVSVNWVVMPDNHGWAYGNNAKRLSNALVEFDHSFDRHTPGDDIAIYFDIRVFKKVGQIGRSNVLRVGGRRPIDIEYGENWTQFGADLQSFDAVIALNAELKRFIDPYHPNVHVIPNGIDCTRWSPETRGRQDSRPFTVGFAANLLTRREREIKGYAFVERACRQLGVPLRTLEKGKKQIPHAEMLTEFYGKIDCLVHPVAPDKEGSSNVIMEALALGIPVITTRECGYHGQHLVDKGDVIYCVRDADDIAAKLRLVMENPGLARKLSVNGRTFALAHHDLGRIVQSYRTVLKSIAVRRFGTLICFVPFWSPPETFASSRLRCLQPTLSLAGSSTIDASIGYDPAADVAIVSQLASDAVMTALLANPHQFVIYDVCDRYHIDDRIVGGVHAKSRFHQLAERADIVVASTIALRRELAELMPGKPVLYVPDGIDYGGAINPVPSSKDGPIVWFGNPGRGNFESARGLLDTAHERLGCEVKLISRKRSFANDPIYSDRCVDWTLDCFISELRSGSVCVVTHAASEPLKSPNRLVTAVANGVPTIVYQSPSCEELLEAAGCGEAILRTEDELASVLARFEDPACRAAYLTKAQDYIATHFSPQAIRSAYEDVFYDCTWQKSARGRPIRVLFVSHNLTSGEGAPTSLLQTVVGLRDQFGIEPIVYSPLDGDLRTIYDDLGIPVILSTSARHSRTLVSAVEKNYAREIADFGRLIDEGNFDTVLCNTAKTLFYARQALERNVPAVAIVRESSDEHVNMSFAGAKLISDTKKALEHATGLVFVSDSTRKLWQARNRLAPTAVISNGIRVDHWRDVTNRPVAEVRRDLGLDPDETIILCVGTITPRKGQKDLVQAFARLDTRARADARVVLVGARPGRYLDEIMTFVESLDSSVAGRISVVAETSEIALWYRAADIYVLASYNESYPRVIMEAMYFGLPVVASAVFGVKEQVINGVSGLLFEAGDIAGLSEYLATLLADPALRARFAKRSQSRFWELSTYEEMVLRYAALLNNLTRPNIRGERKELRRAGRA